ncbi:MAG TPA: trimethylamine methyltransferase family protein [Thermoanaerobaculales bacterium]|nr:trimethylamine methyltransferase family protein [Thermoanaerobaculales bacterium]
MRPKLKLLDDSLVERIVTEAREVLCTLGAEIHNPSVLDLLASHGAAVDRAAARAVLTQDIIERAIATAPSSFELYDSAGARTHRFEGDAVYFTPGSAAITVLDGASGEVRPPTTADYLRYAKLVAGLPHIASQSTAMIPRDVPERISDSYRLYLSLLYCAKPVVTGAFTIEAFEVMKDLQLAVRGSRAELEAKPLTVFSCCPTSPLKWSDVTSQNVVDCATWGIPIELIAMPLSGFMAPVTLTGTLIQHTAETLSGIVISQLTRPGAPVLYGGSPAIFDLRYETTPMGAIETMMINCGYSQIGSWLGLPTQGYIALSDAKQLDAQAGLESGIGAALAALSGINSVSGPGMLDFESCLSLEKLVVDNEICGMTARLVAGIEPRDDFPAAPLLEELQREHHLLIADHTLRHLRHEISFPGPVIDRANRSRWQSEGSQTLGQRAAAEVERLVAAWQPPPLPEGAAGELNRLMAAEARRWGMEKLPERPA